MEMSELVGISEQKPLVNKRQVLWKYRISSKRIAISLLIIFIVSAVMAVTVYFLTRNNERYPATSLPHYDVQKDYIDIQCMIRRAQKGIFDETLWKILDAKPYLINVIPENTSYTLLHYAVLYNDSVAVHRLSNYTSCDVRAKSAPTVTNKNAGGKIPEQLASSDNIRSFLQQFTEKKMNKRFEDTPVFFVTKEKGKAYNTYGLPLLLITISSFKKTFYGNETVNPAEHFRIILQKVYKGITGNLQNVQNEVINSMSGFDYGRARKLRSKTEDEFFTKIIKTYTVEGIYKKVNLVLRLEALFNYSDYRPRSQALHLGPYALMLDSVLTFWSELKCYNNVTYRGVSSNITRDYYINMTFVWLQFVSSTGTKTVAERFARKRGSVFVISNEEKTSWQPRKIAQFSQFPSQNEYLYPPGAEFTVTDMDGRHIFIDLRNPAYT